MEKHLGNFGANPLHNFIQAHAGTGRCQDAISTSIRQPASKEISCFFKLQNSLKRQISPCAAGCAVSEGGRGMILFAQQGFEQ
jgi:hypothetical protein